MLLFISPSNLESSLYCTFFFYPDHCVLISASTTNTSLRFPPGPGLTTLSHHNFCFPCSQRCANACYPISKQALGFSGLGSGHAAARVYSTDRCSIRFNALLSIQILATQRQRADWRSQRDPWLNSGAGQKCYFLHSGADAQWINWGLPAFGFTCGNSWFAHEAPRQYNPLKDV